MAVPVRPKSGIAAVPACPPASQWSSILSLLRHGLDRQRTLLTIMPGGGRPSHAPGLQQRGLWRLEPNANLRPHSYDVAQLSPLQFLPKLGGLAVSGIRQNHAIRQAPAADLVDDVQRQFPLGTKHYLGGIPASCRRGS